MSQLKFPRRMAGPALGTLRTNSSRGPPNGGKTRPERGANGFPAEPFDLRGPGGIAVVTGLPRGETCDTVDVSRRGENGRDYGWASRSAFRRRFSSSFRSCSGKPSSVGSVEFSPSISGIGR